MPQVPGSLKKSLVALGIELLKQNQDAIGWLVSKTRNTVGYSNPVERERVQANLDHTVGLVACAHLVTVFEKHCPDSTWAMVITDPDDRQRLRAYRHLRRMGLEGLGTMRPNEDSEDFDTVMASASPIRGVVSFDEETIVISSDIYHDLCSFLTRVKDKAIVVAHGTGSTA